MSRMGDELRLNKQFRGVLDRREIEPTRFRATQGDGTGTVKVPGKPNFIYIRRVGRSRFEECLNVRTPNRYDLPVVIGYLHELPGVLQVLNVDWSRIIGPGDYPYVPTHHKSHELHNDEGGDDVVWVQSQQILPLLVYPTGPPSMFVGVFGGWYPWDAGWHHFEGVTSADLTGYIPLNAGEARFVLICIDGDTKVLHYESGSIFPQFLPPVDYEDRIPAPPSGKVPLGAIYFIWAMTEIDWGNIYDLRLPNQPVGGSVVPGPHSLLDPAVHHGTVLNSPTQGSLIYGNPPTGTASEWDELVIGTAHQLLKVNAGGTDLAWSPFDWDEISIAAAADMAHDHSAAAEGGPIPLGSLGGGARGSIIRREAAGWAEHEAKNAGWILIGDNTDIVSHSITGDITLGSTGTVTVIGFRTRSVAAAAPNDGQVYVWNNVASEWQPEDQSGGLPAVAAAGYALVSDGVNSWAADQTPAWTGKHSFAAGMAFTGASGANEITVPDNTAIALELLDAGGLEYVRIVSADADPYLLIDPAATGFLVGVGIAVPVAHVDVYDATVNAAATYYGGRFDHTKTAGVTDTADNLCGLMGSMRLNQVGGVVGYVDGLSSQAAIAVGEIGQSGTLRHLRGLVCTTTHTGGTTWGDVMGAYMVVDANAGTIGRDVFGCNIIVDIEAAMASIGQNVYGLRVWMDVDQDPAGTVYGIHLTEGSNQDYGFYQSGSADNYFGGNIGIGCTPTYLLDMSGTNPVYARILSDGGTAGLLLTSSTRTWTLKTSTNSFIIRDVTGGLDKVVVDAAGFGIGAQAGAPLDVTTSTAITNAAVDVVHIEAVSTGNMVDNFGPRLNFAIKDGAVATQHIASLIARRDGADNTGGLLFAVKNAGAWNYTTLWLDPVGRVGIGLTTPAYKLDALEDRANGYVARFFNDGDNVNRHGIYVQCGDDIGAAVGNTIYFAAKDGGGVWTGQLKTIDGLFQLLDVSDERHKTNIVDTRLNGLDIINGLRVRDFNWEGNPEGPMMTSFIAQEAQKVYPSMVSDFGDDTLGTSRAILIPILTKAIQELDARLTNGGL